MAALILCVVVAVMIVERPGASHTGKVAAGALAQAKMQARPAASAAKPDAVVPQESGAPPKNPQPLNPVNPAGQTNSTLQQAVAQTNRAGPPSKPPLQDPMARVALAFVGADAEAETYWYGAINDPSLPPNERQDLIEDLNEDGLSDPKHPTMDDLPLIVSRLLLLEEVGPDAMDEVNAEAFQEAYTDLVNLGILALGGGEPVR